MRKEFEVPLSKPSCATHNVSEPTEFHVALTFETRIPSPSPEYPGAGRQFAKGESYREVLH
jgi:hypothetical protein